MTRASSFAGAVALVLVVAAGWIPRVSAARTRVVTESPGDLARGTADGMAVTSRGFLFVAPDISPVGEATIPIEPGQVWDAVSDRAGDLYLGTGPEGQVVRVDSTTGRRTVFFSAVEPMITALAITPDGHVLAAAAPGGVIYRITPDGEGEVWSETEELYVWALAPGARGKVYAGTGERGRILVIDESGRAELLFDSDEVHIVSLLTVSDGAVVAGGAGRGLVYRIDSDGDARVLHDDELPEVVSLAVDDDERLTAAFVAPPEPESRRPALQLRLPDGVQVGASTEPVGVLEESTGPTLRGVIEGIDPSKKPEVERLRGRVVRIEVGGEATELWASTREAPFCLLSDEKGGLLFGTGEPARLYRVEADGDVAVLATLKEAQVTALVPGRGSVYLATSNPGRAYEVGDGASSSATFLSRPVDAGGFARWGSIRWTLQKGQGRTEFYTRTGNSLNPDGTWSAWSPALTKGAGSPIVNPDGRFLQWRLRQIGSRGIGSRVSAVTLVYEPHNRPPRLREFRLDAPSESVSGPMTFRWAASDPDDDPVEVTLEYRRAGDPDWSFAGVRSTQESDDGKSQAPGWREGHMVWDTAAVAEGQYEIRVLATDQPSNPLGEGRAAPPQPPLKAIVDRTPPAIRVRGSGTKLVELNVEDAHSTIRSVELVGDGRVRFTARPEDGVCDSGRETFRIELSGEVADWIVRGVDAAGNAAEHSLARGRASN